MPLRCVVLAGLLVAAPALARADAIGPCPEGERVVTNPSSPGSMHHGGFHCERVGGCSVAAPGAGSTTVPWLALGLLGLVHGARMRGKAR